MSNDLNRQVIEEFRANAGRVGGRYEGRPLLLLTTTGRNTGRRHTTPVTCLKDGDGYYIFATNGGADQHPAWYLNLVASPQATVEVGAERFEAKAIVTASAERDAIYRRQAALYPHFNDYEHRTSRTIPVVRLTRAA